MRWNNFRILVLGIILTGLPIATSMADRGSSLYEQHCASCHDSGAARTPTRKTLSAMSTAAVVRALETGVMRVVGNFSLNGPERVAVAEFLTGKPFDPNWNAEQPKRCGDTPWPVVTVSHQPVWNGWGSAPDNRRFQSAEDARLSLPEVKRLKLQWAFAFPGETIAESQPTVFGGRLFVGSRSGMVYALNAKTACEYWRFAADAPVKNSVVIGELTIKGESRTLAFFGDLSGNAYAVDAVNGALIWRRKVDPFPTSRLMGSFLLAANQLFIPVTATESTQVAAQGAICCFFRGSLIAIDPATGEERWRRYTVAEEPRKVGTNAAGNDIYGPSGATIWSAPTFDPKRGVVYVGTGENASHPATDTSDAILAIDVESTVISWRYQGSSGDAWNMSCGTADKTNCPTDPGLDHDMGSSPSIATLADGRRVLIAAQKSGVVHALDPDNEGELLWQRKVAAGGILGGIEWGPANDGKNVYVALADIRWNTDDLLDPDLALDANTGGGLVALDLVDGHVVWESPAIDCTGRPQCSPAQTSAVTAIPDVVFAGSMSGHVRAHDAKSGAVIWSYDTVREFDTVNGASGRGGAIDATGTVVVDGWVYVVSGYSKWGGLPGNVLLAFAPEK